MFLFHATVSTFIYFTFMFCIFAFKNTAKTFCLVFRCITTNDNKQILKVIIEICAKISDVQVFIIMT